MHRETKIALGLGVGALSLFALAMYLKKKKQAESAVVCGVAGGVSAGAALAVTLYAENKRADERFKTSRIGRFARQGIDELKSTNWATTITGQKVLEGLERAYKKRKISEQENEGGKQLGWGFFAKMYISKNAINRYFFEKSKEALVLLAHEGSHYTYATRYGLFSGWWRQFEVEGYRINDILNIEFTGRNWIGGTKVRDVERIKDFLKNNPAYKWIPELPFEFNYWNKENIGQ